MWPFTRKPSRGPTGTGRLYRDGRFLFWDDRYYPGLIKDEYKLKQAALADAEVGKMVMAEAMADMVSGGKRDKSAVAEVERYRAKLSAFLLSQANEFKASPWIMNEWHAHTVDEKDAGFQVLCSYCKILDYWNYPFSLHKALDTQDNQTMAILSSGSVSLTILRNYSARQFNQRVPAQPAMVQHCFPISDIVAIKGIPLQFTVDLKEATWTFDWRFGELLMKGK